MSLILVAVGVSYDEESYCVQVGELRSHAHSIKGVVWGLAHNNICPISNTVLHRNILFV